MAARRVLRIAFLSRLLMLVLICLWRLLLRPYDTSASINTPCLSAHHSPPRLADPPLWPRLGSAIERSIVWDSVYFVRIAECGYEYEQTYAFFPILPVLMSLLSRSVFAPLVPVIGYRAVLALSGYFLSNLAFVLAAVYLYRLSVLILRDTIVALTASLLFCFNPASIFYSSIYSESLYALFSFAGLYNFFAGCNTTSVLLLALSGSARSNGVLNAGYFCFQAIHKAYEAIFRKHEAIMAVQEIATGIIQSVCVCLPFVAFQAYGYYNMCVEVDNDSLRPWCKARVPRLYDYVQSHYWGVGFMKYFQLKQLPNFLLASPILSLAVCSISHYVKLRPDLMFSLGIQASPEEKVFAPLPLPSGKGQKTYDSRRIYAKAEKGHISLRQRKKEIEGESFLVMEKIVANDQGLPKSKQECYFFVIIPFVCHLCFLTMTAIFVMHVQVATRFLSSSPLIYWFAAYALASPKRIYGYLIWVYYLTYILLGSLLFSLFYPFT